MGNDTDSDAGDVLSAILISAPAHGTLSLQSDGSFGYAPNTDYNGSDSFQYQPRDNANPALSGASVVVSLTINAVNDAPVGAADAYATDEDTALTVATPGVLSNDSDVDGDALTAIVVSGPTHGLLNLNANGSFVYAPAADYNGSDSFSYRASDGALQSAPIAVSIAINPINDAPVAADGDGGTLTISETRNGTLSATDVDDDASALTFALVQAPAHGEATVNANGTFTYRVTPGTLYTGADSFTFRVTDASGAVSNVARVTFNIVAPATPVVARDDEYSTTDAPGAAVSGNVLSNDSGDGPLSAVLVSDVSQGKLTLNADGSFNYRGNNIFVGDDSFTYRARDNNGNLSAVATVTIHVAHQNRAPHAEPDYYSVGASGTLNLPAPGVLSNDTDADIAQSGNRFGDKLTVSLLATEPPHLGTVDLRPDGSFVYTVNSPVPAQNAYDTFYYNLSDGQGGNSVGRVAISIQPTNHAPVAQSQSLVLGANQYYLPVTLSATDADNEPITYELLSLPTQGTLRSASGAPLSIRRIYDANGIFYQRNNPSAGDKPGDSFTFRAIDSRGLLSDSATVSIRLASVNSAPVAVADEATTTDGAVTIPVAANDTDADGDALRVVAVSGGRNGSSLTIAPDGQSVIYNPGSSFAPGSSDTFSYSVTDTFSAPVVGTVTVRQIRPGSVDGYISSFTRFDGYYGNGVINRDGSGQIANGNTVSPGSNYPGAAAYSVVMRNVGPSPDSFVLRGPAREPGATAQTAHWSVRYFSGDSSSTADVDITAAVTSAAGWTSPSTDNGGATRRVRVEVRPDATVADGATLQTLFNIRSLRDDNARDVVGAISTKGAATSGG